MPPAVAVFQFDWTYPPAFCWGLLVLVSLIGWGQLLRHWLVSCDEEKEFGWGLSAAWGLSAFLVLAGPLLMLSIFSVVFVALFVVAGWGLAGWQVCRRRIVFAGWWPGGLSLRVLWILLLLQIILDYAAVVAAHWYNPVDDFAAYFAHAKMAFDTGTYRDPFNFRLLGSMEGQQTLSALVLGFLPWKYAHILDAGIGGLIMLGLVLEKTHGDEVKAWISRLVLVTLALSFHMPRINTASELTSTVLFMALFRTFELAIEGRVRGWKAALLVGSVVAATATLRCHFVFVVGFLGLGFAALRWWTDGQDRRQIIRESLAAFVVVVVFLAPWCVVSYRSNGSFLYPLVQGTLRPEFQTFSLHLSLWHTFLFVASFFLSTIYLFLFLPACFLKAGPSRQFSFVYGGIILLLSALFLSQYTYGARIDLERYLFPMGLAFGLYTACILAPQVMEAFSERRSFVSDVRVIGATILAAGALLFQSIHFRNLASWNGWPSMDALNARHEFSNDLALYFTDEARREYPEAFSHIPLGAKTLIALDYPFLLDYRAHSIVSIDFAGAASPDPGFPYFRGTPPVREYLRAQGIRYIAHVPFDQGFLLHGRPHANHDLNGEIRMFRAYARYELDLFDNIDQMGRDNRILYDSPTIRVIDLGEP